MRKDRFFHGKLHLAAIGKSYPAVHPPVIVREISPCIQHDGVHLHRAAEIQPDFGIILPVYSPGSIGPLPVGTVFRHTVNGIHCRKNRFSPGFHISGCPRITHLISMLIVYIHRQVTVCVNFKILCLFSRQQMPFPGKYLRRITDSFFTEGNGIFIITGKVHQRFSQGIIQLKPQPTGAFRSFHKDFIPLQIGAGYCQIRFRLSAAHGFYLIVLIYYF